VVEAPFGAHPTSSYPRYAYDRDHLGEYLSAAQGGPEDLEKYLATYVQGTEDGYREAVGAARLDALTTWSQSTSAWKEIFS
jgi:glutaconate CoA-transferase, subunit A